MATVSTFNIALVASTGRFVSNMARAERQWNQFARSVQRQAKVLPQAIRDAVPASLALGRNVSRWAAVATAALSGLSAAGVKLAADFEQSQIAFETLLGSADKAERFLRELEVYARRTPFGFVGLQQASRQLLAYGFTAGQVLDMIEPIGDAVAAMGGSNQMFEAIIRALGQIQAKGKLAAQEFLQLSEQGIPAWQFLADMLGVTIPEAMDMASRGMISSSVAIEAVLTGMTRRFGGAMKRQADTILGRWEQIKDGLTTITRGFGKDVIRILGVSRAMKTLANAVERVADAVSLHGFLGALSKAFPPWLEPTIVGIAGAIVGGLVPAIVAWLIPALKKLAISLWATLVPLTPWIALGAAVALAIWGLCKALGALGVTWNQVWKGMLASLYFIASGFYTMVGSVLHAISIIIPGLRGAAQAVLDYGTALRQSAAAAWQAATAGQQLGDSGDDAASGQKKLTDQLKAAAAAAQSNLQSFDEVHQIQEDMAGLDWDIEVPDIAAPPSIDIGTVGGDWTGSVGRVGEEINKISAAWDRVKESMQPVTQLIADIETGWDNLKLKAGKLKDSAVATWDSMRTSISEKWANIKEDTRAFWDGLGPAISGWVSALPERISTEATKWRDAIVTSAQEMQESAVAHVKEWSDKVVEWVAGLPGRISESVGAWAADIVTSAETMKADALTHVQGWADDTVTWITELPGRISASVTEWADSVIEGARRMKDGAVAHVQRWAAQATQAVTGLPGQIGAAVDEWANGIIESAKRMKDDAVAHICAWADDAVTWVEGLPGRISTVVDGWADKIVTSAKTMKDDAIAHVQAWSDDVVTWVEELPGRIATTVTGWRDTIVESARQMKDDAITHVSAWSGEVVQWVEGLPGLLAGKASSWGNAIVEGALVMKDDAIEHVKAWSADVVKWVGDLPGLLSTQVDLWGSSIVDSAKRMKDDAVTHVKDWSDDVVTWVQELPSRIKDTVNGWGNSIVESARNMKNSALKHVTDWKEDVIAKLKAFPGELATDAGAWVESIVNSAAGLKDRAVAGIVEWKTDTIAKIKAFPGELAADLAAWVDSIVTAASDMKVKAIEHIVAWKDDTITRIKAFPGEAAVAITGWVDSLVNGAIDMKNRAVAQIVAWKDDTIAWIRAFPGEAKEAIVGWVDSLVNGAVDMKNRAVTQIVAWKDDTIAWIKAFPGEAADAITGWINSVVDGAKKMRDDAVNVAVEWRNTTINKIKSFPTEAKQAIEDWVKSVVDGAVKMKNDAAKKAKEMVDAIVKCIGDLPGKAVDKVKEWGAGVIGWFQWAYDTVVGHSIVPDMVREVIAWLGKLATDGVSEVIKAAKGIVDETTTLSDEVTKKLAKLSTDAQGIVQTLGSALQSNFAKAWDGILNKTMTFKQAFQSVMSGMGDTVKQLLVQQLANMASKSLSTLGEWASGVIAKVGPAIVALIQQAYATLVAFFAWSGPLAPALAAGVIGAALAGIGSLVSQVLGSIRIPGLAQGGIVTGPTLAMVGEGHRREAVIPLERDNVIAESVGRAVFDAMMTAERIHQASGGEAAGGQREVVLRIDGATFARLILPHLVREGQRQGMDVVIRPAMGV